MMPLAIDLYCGLGGWTEGLLDAGYRVVGFDNERHVYGDEKYPGQLVIQDVRTIHGRQLKDAALIVASPPCQAYSYRAMPWKRAKALPPPSNELFDACFRIQREAIEASGHFIPLVVENVRGAQPYVGRSKYHFGSFHLWGDVPALMPAARGRKNAGGSWFNVAHNTESGTGQNPVNGVKVGGMSWSDFGKPGYKAQAFNGTAEKRMRDSEGLKGEGGGTWFGKGPLKNQRRFSSKSKARKRASAMIAKIPLVLSRHIWDAWYPRDTATVSA